LTHASLSCTLRHAASLSLGVAAPLCLIKASVI